MEFSLFGTSIPTAAFPGIGASIRMSVAARFSLISSARPTILLTFTPCSGCISNLVTVGPWLISVTVTLTPKVCSVCCRCSAVSFNSLLLSPLPVFFPLCSRVTGGNTYFFAGAAGFFGNPFSLSLIFTFPAAFLFSASSSPDFTCSGIRGDLPGEDSVIGSGIVLNRFSSK